MIIKKKKSTTLAPSRAGVVLKKKLTAFRTSVFTRHGTHKPLRTQLPLLPFRSVIRLGSVTPSIARVECNSIQGVKNSSSKLLMKRCFDRAGVKHSPWNSGDADLLRWADNAGYPIISKSHSGSRGVGNQKHDDNVSLLAFMRSHTISHYIFEKFVPYSREYRLHITQDGCFYACRKLLRNDVPDDTWQRHDDVCVWVVETNPSFKKPNNWNLIVEDCKRAQHALGLDICAFDVLVQGGTEGRERNNPEWLILESCSAPSFGTITTEKYLIEIPKVLRRKHEQR